ncbi:MAG: membrane protein [Hyphococcus sp.]|nr:MAG: membrane protein [Marinicaulis sp.]
MNDPRRQFGASVADARTGAAIDEGLRQYMLGVYNYIAVGLVVSGLLAFAVSTVPAIRDALFVYVPQYGAYAPTPLGSIVSWSPVAILLLNYFVPIGRTPQGAQIFYWTIVTLIGASLGSIGLNFTGESIARIFFITALSFGGMSLWGYTTKVDLTPVGSFLRFAVIGVFAVLMINGLLFQATGLQMIMSVGFLLLMGAAIAFNTQALKSLYLSTSNEGVLKVAAVHGALSLYISIINIFTILMNLFGARD